MHGMLDRIADRSLDRDVGDDIVGASVSTTLAAVLITREA
jgi:hypothetical protein